MSFIITKMSDYGLYSSLGRCVTTEKINNDFERMFDDRTTLKKVSDFGRDLFYSVENRVLNYINGLKKVSK